MDLGRVVKDGWTVSMKDIGPLLLGAAIPSAILFVVAMLGYFVAFVPLALSGQSKGFAVVFVVALLGVFGVILVTTLATVPFYFGLFRMVLARVRAGRVARFGDVTACYAQFWRFVGAYVVLALAVGIGLMLFVVPGLYLATIWAYVLPIMVERPVSLGAAMKESKQLVDRAGFWMTLLCVVVIGVVFSAVGSVTGSVGQFLGLPWAVAALVSMYLTARGEAQLLPSALPPGALWEGGGRWYAPAYQGPPPGTPPYQGPPPGPPPGVPPYPPGPTP